MRVAIIMGSTSDLPKVEPAVTILKEYGVEVLGTSVEAIMEPDTVTTGSMAFLIAWRSTTAPPGRPLAFAVLI